MILQRTQGWNTKPEKGLRFQVSLPIDLSDPKQIISTTLTYETKTNSILLQKMCQE